MKIWLRGWCDDAAKIMITATEIALYLNKELRIKEIEDEANNGLQVENSGNITKVGFAVDASLEVFQKAKEKKCSLVITHHGMLWKGLTSISGYHYQRLKFLVENNIAVYTAHLPLDKHPVYGNNIQLAKMLKLSKIIPFGEYNKTKIGYAGECKSSLENIKNILKQNGMKTLCLNFGPKEIKTVAIVSGGASDEVVQAAEEKMDLYITGEPQQWAHHFAKENKINVIFGGHYETEVWGVKALMPAIKQKFKVGVEFIDVPTIV